MTSLKDKIALAIKLFRQAFGGYKIQIITLIILSFFGAILEGIGINALIPLFSFVVGDTGGPTDKISQLIESSFAFLNIDFRIKYLLILVCALFVIKSIVLILFVYIKAKIGADFEEQTRGKLFRRTMKSSWPHLLKQRIGYLENTLMVDVRFGSQLLEIISMMMTIGVSLIIYLLVAINISVFITSITLILGILLFFFFQPIIRRTGVVANKRVNINKQVAHQINENIMGIKTIKTMSAESPVIEIAKEYFNKLRSIRVETFLLKSLSSSLLQPISVIFVCIVFAISYKIPDFNFVALLAIVYIIQRIFVYLQQMQSSMHQANDAIPHLKKLLEYEREMGENRERSGGSETFKFKDFLEFKNVVFSYNSDVKVLRGINFSLEKGKMVGLIGPSGGGKTTVVDMALRLFTPQEGQILLDKKQISDINLTEWRKKVGYVSQDVFLINDTIANNIKFYDNSITKERMEEAAKMADIYDFINSTPKKFDTIIGERGILLSAGQRQRIVIARVLARKPELLILDEATSALDNESEMKFQKVVEKLKGKVTVLAVAHRLSTIMNSDKLLVLENGMIVEEGTPDDLLKDKKSYFYRVYNIRK